MNYPNFLVHHSIASWANQTPNSVALIHKDREVSYRELNQLIEKFASGLKKLGIANNSRIAVYLPKQSEAVVALFGASRAGTIFVPVNPALKAKQVEYILNDCSACVLITSRDRLNALKPQLSTCENLTHVILVGDAKGNQELSEPDAEASPTLRLLAWDSALDNNQPTKTKAIDFDVAAILYTSGSTGRPKGVVLSHRNIVAGAESVATYLSNSTEDRILAVLPLSFDYGLSQLTTAFRVGATAVLLDYLFPGDVIKACAKYGITGLAAVPPLWVQLSTMEWPEEVKKNLRYVTNSGGAMPVSITENLSQALPNTDIFLMYGLTEAFRSTYLPPDQVKVRPTSMGKAIPNAEVTVLRPDGSECDPDEPGELVHRGALVSLGYWNDPEKTAKRFKPYSANQPGVVTEEMAVWSGDTVKKDAEGFLYFVTREDEMIKTSGYRVSPTELEECIYESGIAEEAVAFGAPHPDLGQAIIVVAKLRGETTEKDLLKHCQKELPSFMVPSKIVVMEDLPRNPNGKIDRAKLKENIIL